MKAADLHKLWGSPDNTRLTAKQQSFRLPVHVAAKINALCELYPARSKTEIVGDLLSSALAEVERSPPRYRGEFCDDGPEGPLYYVIGPAAQFRGFANKHSKALEQELGNENPADLYSDALVMGESEKEG